MIFSEAFMMRGRTSPVKTPRTDHALVLDCGPVRRLTCARPVLKRADFFHSGPKYRGRWGINIYMASRGGCRRSLRRLL